MRVAAVGNAVLGVSAVVVGAVCLVAAALFDGDTPSGSQVVEAYANGSLVGFGIALWSLGLCRSRSLASQVMLYAEPIMAVGFAVALGVASDLRLPLLIVSLSLVIASGVWAAIIEGRSDAVRMSGNVV